MRKINNLCENEKVGGSKSINVFGSKSGLVYQNLERIKSSSQVIVCEGEADYLVLRMLGYDNVIGNIGGASACRDIIRDITKHIDKVIIAYDNDVAGKKAAEKLEEFCNRKMTIVSYPDREDAEGNKYKDINDYFCGGYTKEDFDDLFFSQKKQIITSKTTYMTEDEKFEKIMKDKNPFVYLRKHNAFFDIYHNKVVRKDAVCDWLGCTAKDIRESLNT